MDLREAAAEDEEEEEDDLDFFLDEEETGAMTARMAPSKISFRPRP